MGLLRCPFGLFADPSFKEGLAREPEKELPIHNRRLSFKNSSMVTSVDTAVPLQKPLHERNFLLS